ncbi:hypothetical protein EAI_00171 [Harpegnathos saltator]|uniref:Uncharacterized protein n=1 Tax=Harpegnathos saltator TaxID=610380 RepID=E2BL21_HARSA|nr:hypothetical protein EAI_00171 [Harpegnathos saltator]
MGASAHGDCSGAGAISFPEPKLRPRLVLEKRTAPNSAERLLPSVGGSGTSCLDVQKLVTESAAWRGSVMQRVGPSGSSRRPAAEAFHAVVKSAARESA